MKELTSPLSETKVSTVALEVLVAALVMAKDEAVVLPSHPGQS